MMDSSSRDRAQQLSRRMDEALSVARFVGASAVLFSLVAIFFWGRCHTTLGTRWIGALLAMASLPLGWVSAASGRWSRTTTLAVMGFLFQVGWLAWLLRHSPDWVQIGAPILRDTMLILAGSTMLAPILVVCRLLGPARASVLAATLGVGLIAVVIVDQSRRPSQDKESSSLDQSAAGQSRPQGAGGAFEGNPTEKGHFEWSISVSKPDPILDFCNQPNSALKTYYSEDPRGYLDREPATETLDMRVFRIDIQPGVTGEFHREPSRSAPIRFRLKSVPENSSWKAGANQLAVVAPGRRYSFLVRARADHARPITLAVDRQDDNATLSRREMGIDSQWSWVALPFVTPASTNRVVVRVQVGHERGEVEFADAALVRCREAGLGQVDMRAAVLQATTPGRARVESLWADRADVVVSDSQGDPKDAILTVSGFPIQSGRRYSLSFRAKANPPAQWQARVRGANPKEIFCPAEMWNVGGPWRDCRVEWESLGSSDDATLEFLVGGVPNSLAIANVSLAEAGTNPEASSIRYDDSPWRYSMLHEHNSAGYRDRPRSLAKPPGVFRIACLGDSLTYGQGVRAPDRCSDLLEAELNRRVASNGLRFEVLNFGVCGYNTQHERIVYEHVASKYSPDLVLVFSFTNDALTSEEERDYFNKVQEAEKKGLLGLPERLWSKAMEKADFGRCARELTSLAANCRANGSKLAVFLFRYGHAENWHQMEGAIRPAMAALSVPFCDLGESITKGRDPNGLKVHPKLDGHPNEIAHREAARAVIEFLVSQGLIPSNAVHQAATVESSSSGR